MATLHEPESQKRLRKLSSRLNQKVSACALDHELFDHGDRVLVCLSGGKDSYTLLTMLQDMAARVPFSLELVAFHLDQKQPGYPADVMREYLEGQEGLEWVIAERDTYSIVQEKLPEDATPCSLCSRLRRGIIYATAEEHRCNKIALGHHRDDSIETLLLNLFHTGQMQGMPARYTTDDGRFEVVRPLMYVAEEDVAEFARLMEYPIIPCNLCGSVQTRRVLMKQLLENLEEKIPDVRNSLLAAMTNVRVSHLLDRDLQRRVAPGSERSAAEADRGDERSSLGGCQNTALF